MWSNCWPWQWGKIDQGFIVYWICVIYLKKLNYIGYKGKGYR